LRGLATTFTEQQDGLHARVTRSRIWSAKRGRGKGRVSISIVEVNDLEPNEGYNALQLRALPDHLHDPDFWRALATARKWQDVNAWRFHWHRFIRRKDVESFFAAL
jgi:hypothetical protein